jgi:putative hydrolase of the HAD superfamily
MIRTVFLDFGGVIAEEGFYNGLKAIAVQNGLEPDSFFRLAEEIIHETGYVTGKTSEHAYWDAVRERTGLRREDAYLREEILSRFIVRPEMLTHADRIRTGGRNVCILSDQTDWLDELDRRSPFFGHFDRVFNSYLMHKSKRDASVFTDVCRELALGPEEVLFVDDNINNINRAAGAGLRTVHFTDLAAFVAAMNCFGI